MNDLIQYIEDASNNPIVEGVVQAAVISVLFATLAYSLFLLA